MCRNVKKKHLGKIHLLNPKKWRFVSDVFPIENSPLNFGDMTLTSFFGGDIPWGIFLRLVPMPQWMVGAHEVGGMCFCG